MKKHLYEIKRLDIPAYLKWWFIKYRNAGTLSEVMENLTSPITLLDSLRRKFKIFEIGGNSEQETFTGRNLLPSSSSQSITENGITFTSNGDGSYRASGTATADALIYINLESSVTLPNETLYVHFRNNVIADASLKIGSSSKEIGPIFSNTNKIQVSGSAQNLFVNRIGISVTSGTTIDVTFKPSIETTNEVTDYEKYVGGQPAPRPDYECPIQNVTGNVDVKVENKNLFDKNTQITNGWYNDNGELIDSSLTAHFVNNIKVKTNTQYTISGYLIINLPNINYANFSRIYFFDANQNFISRTPSITTNDYTFNTPQNCEYINFQLYNDNNYSNYKYSQSLNTFQLEEGSVTDYVPHEEQTVTFPLAEGQRLHKDDVIRDKIVQKRGTIALDGTETIESSSYGTNTYLITTSISVKVNDNDVLIISNFFKGIPRKDRTQTVNNIIYIEGPINVISNKFVLRNTNFTSVEELRTFLLEKYANGTPVILEYELAEPLEIPFTSSQATAKAQIDKLYSYKGTTHISSDNEVSPIFKIQYVKED